MARVRKVPAGQPRPPSVTGAVVTRLLSCSGLSWRSSSSTALAISAGSATSRSSWSRWVSSRCAPLPIRLVVVSWPALSRKMHWCSSSSSLSGSPSPTISRVSTSTSGSPGRRRRSATSPRSQSLNSTTAAWPRASTAGAGAGSSAERIASDHSRRLPRSSAGTASRLPMTSIGMRAAKSAIRSGAGAAASASSRRSTSAASPGSMRASARGLSAVTIGRRTRVCSGGALKTRLLVWCSYSGVPTPNRGPNSARLSELTGRSR